MICSVCEKPFTHRGALNLHEYHCKFKQLRDKNISVQTAPVKEECDHSFRFLNSKDHIENIAIKNGYSEVCVKCQNLQV